jgi:2-keto-4-pentenoate hydratase/2-oxohepta-3-ene-1,7-dioic acid hydratase in catechol pathway
VILSGTPWAADESVLELHPGDTVSVDIEGVGRLANPVAPAPLPAGSVA